MTESSADGFQVWGPRVDARKKMDTLIELTLQETLAWGKAGMAGHEMAGREACAVTFGQTVNSVISWYGLQASPIRNEIVSKSWGCQGTSGELPQCTLESCCWAFVVFSIHLSDSFAPAKSLSRLFEPLKPSSAGVRNRALIAWLYG